METTAIGTTEIQGRGRAMVALRPLHAGEIILRDSPILLYSAFPFQPDDHCRSNTYCSNCFTTISQQSQIISCFTCSARFCTLDCQSIASAASHTPWACQTLIRLRNYFSDNRLPSELQIQARFLVSAYNLAFTSQSKFQTLLSFQGSASSGSNSDSDSAATFLHSLISSVCPPLPVELGLSLELTTILLAKDKLNAFGLMEPFSEHEDRSVRAYGIYPVASFFNHDCLPNACRFDYLDAVKSSIDNTEITIRMIHDVPQGREICLSYFPVNLKYSERQKRLLDDYGFVCDCDRCKVESGWSESDEGGLDMDDDNDDGNEPGEGNQENSMDEDIDEQMDGEDGGEMMKGEDDFPHAYFFLNYMCDRKNCGGTLAPLPPSAARTGVMECNVCGSFKNLDQPERRKKGKNPRTTATPRPSPLAAGVTSTRDRRCSTVFARASAGTPPRPLPALHPSRRRCTTPAVASLGPKLPPLPARDAVCLTPLPPARSSAVAARLAAPPLLAARLARAAVFSRTIAAGFYSIAVVVVL